MLAEFHVLFSHWQPYSVGLNTWGCITLRKLEMREKNEHSNVKLTHVYVITIENFTLQVKTKT